MGGGLGAQIISQLAPHAGAGNEIIAIGTNALATSNMVRAGAARGATGENAVVVSLPKAGIVVGPIGIVIPNAMMGEITPKIAEAVAGSDARKVLLPVSQTHFEIIGLESRPMGTVIKEATARIVELVREREGGSRW